MQNKNSEKSSLLFLLGDTDQSIGSFDNIVVSCPIRHAQLKAGDVNASLFGDFSPPQYKGEQLDIELLETLDQLLQEESQKNQRLRWAPIGLQSIRYRLSHYLWIKECLRNVFNHFSPRSITVSSDKNIEFLYALQVLAQKQGMELTVLDGELDELASYLYRMAVYDLPQELDPMWFIKLRWTLLKLMRPKAKILYQWYWNIGGALKKPNYISFNHRRAINFIGSALRKFLRMAKISKETVIDLAFTPSLIDRSIQLTTTGWDKFSRDEQRIVCFALSRFYERYTSDMLDQIQKRYLAIFDIIKPKRIILMADQICSARFLSYLAHKKNIIVDDLIHGIVWENYSGHKKSSDYWPDRYLAWNSPSAKKYQELKWNTITIAHPRNTMTAQAYKPLSKDWQKIRILVLAPEWTCVSQEGRQDCFETFLLDVYESLTKAGIPTINVYIKWHPSIYEVIRAKENVLRKLKDDLDIDFSVIENGADTLSIIPSFDLVISSITSGIFETVIQGVPIVIFADNLNRVGALTDYNLPTAVTPEELQGAIINYDNNAVKSEYKEIINSLQAGESLELIEEY